MGIRRSKKKGMGVGVVKPIIDAGILFRTCMLHIMIPFAVHGRGVGVGGVDGGAQRRREGGIRRTRRAGGRSLHLGEGAESELWAALRKGRG